MQTHAAKQLHLHSEAKIQSQGGFQFNSRQLKNTAQNQLKSLADNSPLTSQLVALQAKADAGNRKSFAQNEGLVQMVVNTGLMKNKDRERYGKYSTMYNNEKENVTKIFKNGWKNGVPRNASTNSSEISEMLESINNSIRGRNECKKILTKSMQDDGGHDHWIGEEEKARSNLIDHLDTLVINTSIPLKTTSEKKFNFSSEHVKN